MRPGLSRREFLKLGSAALLSAALRSVPAPEEEYPAPPIIYRGSPRDPTVAFTYDDCYLLTRLHMLEDILQEHPQARVTLFAVGEAVLNNEGKEPGIWKRFFEAGHEFGYHSFSHNNLETFSPRRVLDDFDRWLAALTQVLGVQPDVHFARPPFDILSGPFLNMCGQRGLVATLYSIGGGGPADTVMKSIRLAQDGEIIQFHTREQPDSQDMTTTARALPYFEGRGMQCVALSRLYDGLLREERDSDGCDVGPGASLTRTCIE